MEEINEYKINNIDNKNKIVSFKTKCNKWNMKLESPKDEFMSSIVIRIVFYFNGDITIDRFIYAMNESFKHYEIFLTTINQDENNDIYINYNGNEYFNNLEIEIKNHPINHLLIDDSLPCIVISNSQYNGKPILNCKDDQVIKTGAFKLTVLNDGYAIGFNISHSLFDLCGILYYFKYLSHIYMYGLNNIKLNKPILSDYIIKYKLNNGQLVKEYKYDIDDPNNLNYYYKSVSPSSSLNPLSNNLILNIIFNLNEIDMIKNQSPQCIYSKNDIITSILFKLFTFTSKLNNDDIYTIRYICNIRNLAGIKEESLGNHFKYCAIPLKVLDIRSLSIIQLAKIVHNSNKSITLEQYINDLEYFKLIKLQNHKVYNYFYPSIYSTTISSWIMNYDQIKFGNSSIYSIKSYCRAAFSMNTIKFDINQNNERVYTTSISIQSDNINQIIQLSNNSKLFTIYK